jgi:hypothetical protein
LPPLINRFSKVELTYSSALTLSQRQTRETLSSMCKVTVGTGVNALEMNILKFLIPGLSNETLDSAVCAFSTLDSLIKRLCFCFSQKNLRRLLFNLVEGLNTSSSQLVISSWHERWKEHECDLEFVDVAMNSIEMSETNSQHLMIITEQLQLNESSVIEVVTSIFKFGEDESNVIVTPTLYLLNQTTSQDIQVALTSLRRVPTDENTRAVSVFVIDTTSSTQSVPIDSFMYAVSSETFEIWTHVVLIVVVPDMVSPTSKQSEVKVDGKEGDVSVKEKVNEESKFSFIFDSNWSQVFADEVVPEKLYEEQEGSLLSTLERDVLFHEILDEKIITALVLKKDHLTTLSQSLSSTSSEVDKNINYLKLLFSKETPLKSTIIQLLVLYTSKYEVTFQRWSKLALMKARFFSDSLCATYIDYIGGFVIRVLLHIFEKLSQFRTLQVYFI